MNLQVSSKPFPHHPEAFAYTYHSGAEQSTKQAVLGFNVAGFVGAWGSSEECIVSFEEMGVFWSSSPDWSSRSFCVGHVEASTVKGRGPRPRITSLSFWHWHCKHRR